MKIRIKRGGTPYQVVLAVSTEESVSKDIHIESSHPVIPVRRSVHIEILIVIVMEKIPVSRGVEQHEVV